MKSLGVLFIAIAVLFLVGWGCHDWLRGGPAYGSAPTELLLLILWTAFWAVCTLIAGAFGLVYLVLHLIVQNDTMFTVWALGSGIVCMAVGALRSIRDS